MKKSLFLFIFVIIFFSGFISISEGQNQESSCKCITDALTEIQTIKVGMKLKDLNKLFRVDGGLSPVNPQRFVYRKCMFVKIEVKFDFVERDKQFPKPNPEDRIIEVSRPYLEEPLFD